MDKFLTYTVLGLSQAAIFAVASSGLVVTYTTSGIFNFAHGAFGMLAAFAYWQFHVAWGVPVWPAFFVVTFILAPLFGSAVERFIMRGIEGAAEVVKIVVTISLMVALIFLALWIWPDDRARPLGALIQGGDLTIAGVVLPNQRLLTIGVAIAVAILLRLVLRGTRLGIAMRAVVDDRALLQLNGGRPGRTAMLSWALGASLAATSGILIAAEQAPSAVTLTLLVINAYAAAVVGRLRSLPGAFLGSIILGLTMSYVGGYLPQDAAIGPISLTGLQQAVPAIMLFVVIVLQPQVSLRAHSVGRPRAPMRVPSQRFALAGGAVLVLSVAALGSMIAPSDLTTVVVGFGFAIATLSLVPLTGYAGQISLAQLTFTGIGAVVMANWGSSGSPVWVAVSIVVCAVVGAVIALPALRLTGIYLALATAAFGLFCTWMVFNQQGVMTGGTVQVPPLTIGGFSVDTDFKELVLLAVLFATIANLLVLIRRGSLGRRLAAMKDSPVACATLGLNLTATKVGVFALSAAIAGAGGALAHATFTSDSFSLVQSLQVTMLAVVGGIGSVGGALIGGLLLGSFSLGATVFAANAIGVFGYLSLPVTKILTVLPGSMGISLGRNPDGAAADIGESYRAFSRSVPAMMSGGVLVFALWLAAKQGAISNWSFVAALMVVLLAALPVLPAIFPPPGVQRTGRTVPAALWLLLAVTLAAALPWATFVSSNGYRVLMILVWAVMSAVVAIGVLGENPTTLAPPAEPSPDLLGVDGPLTRTDALVAGRVIGLDEAELVASSAATRGSGVGSAIGRGTQ